MWEQLALHSEGWVEGVGVPTSPLVGVVWLQVGTREAQQGGPRVCAAASVRWG